MGEPCFFIFDLKFCRSFPNWLYPFPRFPVPQNISGTLSSNLEDPLWCSFTRNSSHCSYLSSKWVSMKESLCLFQSGDYGIFLHFSRLGERLWPKRFDQTIRLDPAILLFGISIGAQLNAKLHLENSAYICKDY